ncbi:Nuclear pore complex protein NUP43 [Linum perenne]
MGLLMLITLCLSHFILETASCWVVNYSSLKQTISVVRFHFATLTPEVFIHSKIKTSAGLTPSQPQAAALAGKENTKKPKKTLTMAINGVPQTQIHRLPQSRYIDAVRWLPSISPLHQSSIIAFFDTDEDSSSLEVHSLDDGSQSLTFVSSWSPPSRISSLRSTHSSTVASTVSGSVHIFSTAEAQDPSLAFESVVSAEGGGFHVGRITGVDLMEGGSECVSVGEDGRVNLVRVLDGSYRKVFDGNGLVSYSAVKWASPWEFITGGCGFGLQMWDIRRPGSSAVAQFKGNLDKERTSGIIHSVDVHPSRKHICLAGGSSGTVFAWDVRGQQQPILLSGAGSDTATPLLSESEVWENFSSSKILPAMFCSEDGILAVLEQGEEPAELLAEPCAINSFDIDRQNPSEVICSLEWESIAIVSRP